MKNIYLLILVLFSLNIFAQNKIKVEETNASFDNGKHNALKVVIYEAKQKDVEKAWKSLMKSYNAKVSMKKTIFADNATIKDMSENTVDVYATTDKTKDGDVILYVAFDLGGEIYLESSHGDKFKTAKKIIRKFAVETTKDALKDKIKDAEKILSSKQKEQKNLEKENENLKNDIEDYKKKIEKAKNNIKENEKQQADKKKEIEEQQSIVNKLNEKEKSVK